MNIFTEWDNLKDFISNKNLDMFYKEYSFKYVVYTVYNYNIFCVEMWKDTSKCKGLNIEVNNSWLSDFENNYKTNARNL